MSPKKTTKKNKKLKLVLVEWEDGYSYYGNSYMLKEARNEGADKWIVRDVGFLIDDCDDYVVLSESWSPETFPKLGRGARIRNEEHMHVDKFKNLHVIPRPYIKSIQVLKEFDCVAFNDSD